MSMLIFNGRRSFAPLKACWLATIEVGVTGLCEANNPPPLSNHADLFVIVIKPVGTLVKERIALRSSEMIWPAIASSSCTGKEVLKLKKLPGCDMLKFWTLCACAPKTNRSWKKVDTPGLPELAGP